MKSDLCWSGDPRSASCGVSKRLVREGGKDKCTMPSCDGPDEPRQFARDRGGYSSGGLSGSAELSIPAAQPHLRFPGRITDRFWQAFLLEQLFPADPCRKPVTPCGLDKHTPGGAVTCFRYTALTPGSTARMLRGNQAEIRHELARVAKACDVTQFRNHGRSGHKGQTAERLQCVNDRRQRPSPQASPRSTRSTCRGFDCFNAVFQHNVVRRLLEPQSGQPATMHQGPGGATVMTTLAQQKARELLAGLP